MKRSTQVTLVLMGAAGVGGIGYALSADCRQPAPSAVASDAPQPACGSGSCRQAAAGAVANVAAQSSCRSGGTHFSSSSHGGSGFFGFGSSSAGTSTSTTSASVAAPSVQRGGFGSFGRMVASFSGGG